jgi:hypothetical protein
LTTAKDVSEATAFECLVGKKAQERHRDRRHPAAAPAAAGLALAARAVLHAGEDILQAHRGSPMWVKRHESTASLADGFTSPQVFARLHLKLADFAKWKTTALIPP